MQQPAIGIDLAEIARFRTVLKAKNFTFISNTFSLLEQKYCSSYKDSAPRFAGTFAAKEAVRKTSEKFWIDFNKLEIRRTKEGKPEVWIRGKKIRNLSISITYTKTLAAAVALLTL